jgi:glycosyltransferase involved in cell wall biosynthesis
VLHVHGSNFDDFFMDAPWFLQFVIRATLERADAVIALGNTWAARLQRMSPRAHIVVVANAIRLAPRVPQTELSQVHVVFLGEIGRRKGTFELLESWAKVASNSEVGPVRLTIAGDGDISRARELVSALAIGETVEVRGWITPDEVSKLLADAQVLVLPSRHEGQPMAILEAMARGICVVASNVGGIPDMLGNSGVILTEPGNVAELADALVYVVTDHAARALLGSRARRRVEAEFNVDVVQKQFSELYRRVVANEDL